MQLLFVIVVLRSDEGIIAVMGLIVVVEVATVSDRRFLHRRRWDADTVVFVIVVETTRCSHR